MKLLLLVCLYIGLGCSTRRPRKNMIPFELRRAMINVTSLDSFFQSLSFEEGYISSLRNDVRSLNQGKHFTKGILHGRLSDNFDGLPLVILDSAECKARPVAIEVPQPVRQDALYFPFFVTLHRCGGACNSRPFETKCEVQESEDLNLVVNRVAWLSASDKLHELSREITTVRITNHTKCGCKCAIKATDCNNRTERYNENTCRCECKSRSKLCPFNFKWDPLECQCKCNLQSSHRCNKRYQFDEKLCKCVCSGKKCKMPNKVRDPKDCRCKCPRLVCPRGMHHDRRKCQCIGNRRRSIL